MSLGFPVATAGGWLVGSRRITRCLGGRVPFKDCLTLARLVVAGAYELCFWVFPVVVVGALIFGFLVWLSHLEGCVSE